MKITYTKGPLKGESFPVIVIEDAKETGFPSYTVMIIVPMERQAYAAQTDSDYFLGQYGAMIGTKPKYIRAGYKPSDFAPEGPFVSSQCIWPKEGDYILHADDEHSNEELLGLLEKL